MDNNENDNYNYGFDEDEDDNNQQNNNFYQDDNINENPNNNINYNNNYQNNNNNNQFNDAYNYNNNNHNNQFNEPYYNNNIKYQNNEPNNNLNNYNQMPNNQYNQNYNQLNKNNYGQYNNQNNNYNNNFNNQNNLNNFNYNNNSNFNNNNGNQYNNINNNPNSNFNNQNKNKRIPCKNPDQEKLRNAYDLYMLGIKDYKSINLEIALDRFEKAKEIIDEVYPKIEKDKKLKETTDKFLENLKRYMSTTQNRIKTKYNYVPTYSFGGKTLDPKQEVARFLKETERASKQKPKINYFAELNKKPKFRDSPSMYINQYKNNNINNNNTNNNANNKKDGKSIITNDLRDKVLSEIVENKPDVKFSDVVGLKDAKEILREIIIVPNLRPDLFKGLRAPPRGLLLFGPPGTGKTMIAKAVATECKCTFFNISASSLTSKYLGESEKLVRTLFELAHEMQPSVVFVDEIESILSKRKEDENDAMKRLKTEFLIQFDGVGSSEDLRVLIIGATNRPFDLDPAIIRRLPKRVYVGPFNAQERKGFIKTIISQNKCDISDEEFLKIAEMCNNYSNSDLKELCREAAYEPLRELNVKKLEKVEELRPIVYEDFNKAIRKVRGTLTKKILKELEDWNKEFGAISKK